MDFRIFIRTALCLLLISAAVDMSAANSESKTEYVRQIAKSEEGIMEADRIAQRMSEDDANWFRQNSIDIARRDRNAELSAAIEKGRLAKAVENALTLVRDYNASPEEAAEKMGAPLELVLDALKQPAAN